MYNVVGIILMVFLPLETSTSALRMRHLQLRDGEG